MKVDGLSRMLDFLDLLRSKNIEFRLDQFSPDALTVTFSLVGMRIEATFDPDMMHYCVFKGSEAVSTDSAALLRLIGSDG